MSQELSRRDFLKMASIGFVGVGFAGSALALSSCSKKKGPSGEATAVAQGKGGDVEVTVTVEDGTITAVDVVGENEYPDIGTVAMEEVPQLIVSKQSFEVDGTAGATLTSDAIKEAGQAAYDEIVK